MTDKKKKKSEITKTYIYEGAIHLFSTQGFENTTVRDIAKDRNISLGSLYYHFKSKEDILIHYFKLLQEQTTLGVAPILESKQSTSKKVLSVIEVNMALLQKNSKISKDLINSTANVSHPLSPFGKDLRDCQKGAVDLFRQALSSNHKKGEYLDSLAFLYWFYYLGLCLMWANDESKESQLTEDLMKTTYPLTKKLVTLTRFGVGKKLLIKLTGIMRAVLIKE